MRLHNCSRQGCHNKVAMNIKYCDKHIGDSKSQYNNQYQQHYNKYKRNTEANSFYQSKEWKHMRDYIVSRDMNVCQYCGNPLETRVIVDHLHPLQYAPLNKLDSNNLYTICYKCHQVKTMIEQQTAQSPNGSNKLKHMSYDWYKKQIKRVRARDEQQGR